MFLINSMKTTISKIKSMKGKEKITMLTAYDCFTAKMLDEAGIDYEFLTNHDDGMHIIIKYEKEEIESDLIVYDDDSSFPPWDPNPDGNPGTGSDLGFVTSVFIRGLIPFQTYYLSVAAYNSAGLGDYADPVTTAPVSIEDVISLPNEFELYQNYPNPFNPVTVIEYSLPKTSEVSIFIYNLEGEEVLHLVNDNMRAGNYRVKWDGSNMPSGVYLYRLQAGDFIQTRKMVLLK